MSTQPLSLRLANALESGYVFDLSVGKLLNQCASELRRLHEVNQELLEALELAVRQNSHDMLMTGEELRQCESAIAKATGEQA